MGEASEYPANLLDDVYWVFGGPGDLTRADLEREVAEGMEGLPADEQWDAAAVVLYAPVAVLFTADPPGVASRVRLCELWAGDGRAFTAGELFHKLYLAAGPDLRDACHSVFAGLGLVASLPATDAAGRVYGVPVYAMMGLGS